MLRVGLTGGIGSGKSTVAERLARLGAVVIDADRISREVVASGTEGLAEIAARFGTGVLDGDGALDRAAMARLVFADEEARRDLNGIVHPRVAARTSELVAEAGADAVVVHDVPLLVENGYQADYHLVIVVDAPVEQRVRRLVERGLPEEDARARIDAQVSEERRREAADVWLDNDAELERLHAAVDELWWERLVPFETNLRSHRPCPLGGPRVVEPDPEWPRRARRLLARIDKALGERAPRADHIGSTSVPGLPGRDVIDLQLTVRDLSEADELAVPLAEAGLPPLPGSDADEAHDGTSDPAQWRKRTHVSADPGQRVNLHLRVAGAANWRFALLCTAWLRADEAACREYAALKRDLAVRFGSDPDPRRYVEAKQPWFGSALPRAERWAAESGWRPPRV
ncbi:dephospho-CoA kinase [Actinopolyspora erythraea]|uniref:Dephospho-CoA kinase n=1 Tax=Actinopolyspora erythraea TaxID=414996 RepID=A0A099D741_9ACTN|nr:dephospho-CoA kinase [Actinopolyspora erythraea]ASU80963.1 dephospho-CoA kinase [Actinopolyspora erythraea]KGI81953.1 dephospho-CoA kinase [Actinopolyspora erythraea]